MSAPRFFAGLLLSIGAASFTSAQRVGLQLDPVKSSIEFTLGDVLHTVHGTFRLRAGHLEYDAGKQTISGMVTVDAASGDSGSTARDSRMKKNILEADRYPEITFQPTSVQGSVGAAVAAVVVEGDFRIHGQSHALAIPMQVKTDHAVLTATGQFTVPYVAWGMKNPSTFLLRVDQNVAVRISAVGSIAP